METAHDIHRRLAREPFDPVTYGLVAIALSFFLGLGYFLYVGTTIDMANLGSSVRPLEEAMCILGFEEGEILPELEAKETLSNPGVDHAIAVNTLVWPLVLALAFAVERALRE